MLSFSPVKSIKYIVITNLYFKCFQKESPIVRIDSQSLVSSQWHHCPFLRPEPEPAPVDEGWDSAVTMTDCSGQHYVDWQVGRARPMVGTHQPGPESCSTEIKLVCCTGTRALYRIYEWRTVRQDCRAAATQRRADEFSTRSLVPARQVSGT